MTKNRLELLLELAATTLADIAFSEDMTHAQRRKKAERIYKQIRDEFNGLGAEDQQ